METDYSTLCNNDFLIKMRDYAAFLVKSDMNIAMQLWKGEYVSNPQIKQSAVLSDRQWRDFKYNEIFEIKKGFYNKKPEHIVNGEIPFIWATDSNNGITSLCTRSVIEETSKTGDDKNAPITEKLFEPNCITVSNNGSV